MRLVTLCGSLRARSSNRTVLRAYASLAPQDAVVVHYERMGLLPHFNPDLDGEGASAPDEVVTLRTLLATADAVIVSTPEYVHALPGAFKNALDWLVSDPAFAGKPVVILHVARGSTWALDSLREVLRTMSADLIEEAGTALPLGSNTLDEATLLARDDLRGPLEASMAALVRRLAGERGPS